MGTKKTNNMKTNNTQISSLVTQFVTDIVIANLAVRRNSLANRVYARRSYGVDGEIEQIDSELSRHIRIPSEQVEVFCAAMAKARKPAVELSLSPVAGPERRNPRTHRPWAQPMFETAAPAVVMADWSPSAK